MPTKQLQKRKKKPLIELQWNPPTAVCMGRTLAVTGGLLMGSSRSLFGAPLSHGQPRCHSTQRGRGTALSSSCAEHAVAPRVLTVQQRTGGPEGPCCVCPAGPGPRRPGPQGKYSCPGMWSRGTWRDPEWDGTHKPPSWSAAWRWLGYSRKVICQHGTEVQGLEAVTQAYPLGR